MQREYKNMYLKAYTYENFHNLRHWVGKLSRKHAMIIRELFYNIDSPNENISLNIIPLKNIYTPERQLTAKQ